MKKKIVSKVFAILLAACTVLSACGNESGNQSVGQTDKSETNDTVQEGEEPYTIVYAFDVWVQQADWDLVEENLSNIVYDKIGAKVKLLPMTGANYQQEVNLMITSGEKLDLVNASARTTFSSDVTSNKLLGLDEETVRKYAPDIVLICFVLFCTLPTLLLVTSSLSDNDSVFRNGYSFWPKEWSLEAYRYMATQGQTIFRAYGISILTTFIGTISGLMLTAMLGYTLSRNELPGRKIINFLVFFTLLFNGGMVPTYLLYVNTLHVKNTIFALLLPNNILVNGFNVLLVRTYFNNNTPKELIESAMVDGAKEFRIFFSIIMPISKPILATVGLLIGIGYWNDWYNGLLYLTNTKLFSLQNYLNRILLDIQFMTQSMAGSAEAANALGKMPTITVRMAIAVIGILPLMIIFPFFQSYFARGMTVGAVKG